MDRSLAYELFGFSLEGDPSHAWAPETLAVYLSRLLNKSEDSPFNNHILIGVQDIENNNRNRTWKVSMATVVDGILKLISSNPKKDRDFMYKKSVSQGRNRNNLTSPDKSPLRLFFINENDKGLYFVKFL